MGRPLPGGFAPGRPNQPGFAAAGRPGGRNANAQVHRPSRDGMVRPAGPAGGRPNGRPNGRPQGAPLGQHQPNQGRPAGADRRPRGFTILPGERLQRNAPNR
jgi:hypothetical protein